MEEEGEEERAAPGGARRRTLPHAAAHRPGWRIAGSRRPGEDIADLADDTAETSLASGYELRWGEEGEDLPESTSTTRESSVRAAAADLWSLQKPDADKVHDDGGGGPWTGVDTEDLPRLNALLDKIQHCHRSAIDQVTGSDTDGQAPTTAAAVQELKVDGDVRNYRSSESLILGWTPGESLEFMPSHGKSRRAVSKVGSDVVREINKNLIESGAAGTASSIVYLHDSRLARKGQGVDRLDQRLSGAAALPSEPHVQGHDGNPPHHGADSRARVGSPRSRAAGVEPSTEPHDALSNHTHRSVSALRRRELGAASARWPEDRDRGQVEWCAPSGEAEPVDVVSSRFFLEQRLRELEQRARVAEDCAVVVPQLVAEVVCTSSSRTDADRVKWMGAWSGRTGSESSFQLAWNATEEERVLTCMHEAWTQAGLVALPCARTPSDVERLGYGQDGDPRWKHCFVGVGTLDKLHERSRNQGQGKEPWPSDVKLYQPYEVEQILLPDNANCLATQAFLKMSKLQYTVEPRSNAEFMSPSGKVPFIQCGAFVVSELEPIVSFVASKGVSLTNDLDNGEKADMRAYMSLISNVLATAELFITWCDAQTYKQVTKPRYGSVFPWPLNHLLCWQKRSSVTKRLHVLGWANKTLDDVFHEVDQCCQALSERLGPKNYFFGDKPTELDALVFGHLFTVLTTPLPNNKLAATIRGYRTLVDLCKRIEHEYFELPTST